MHPGIPSWESAPSPTLRWNPYFCLRCESLLRSVSRPTMWWRCFKVLNVLPWQVERNRRARLCPPVLIPGWRRACPCVSVRVQLCVPVLQCEGGALAQWGSAGTGGQHTTRRTLSHQAPHHVWRQFVCPSWGCGSASTGMNQLKAHIISFSNGRGRLMNRSAD